jgi:hypothetical protein
MRHLSSSVERPPEIRGQPRPRHPIPVLRDESVAARNGVVGQVLSGTVRKSPSLVREVGVLVDSCGDASNRRSSTPEVLSQVSQTVK